MKRSVLFLTVLLLCVCVTGCKDDDAAPEPSVAKPSISLDVPGVTVDGSLVNLSVRKDSVLTVDYQVTAEAGLASLVVTINGKEEVIDVADKTEIAGQLVVVVPFENVTIPVSVEAKDVKGDVVTASVSIEVTATGPKHGQLRAIVVEGAGTKTDYNDGNYTFAGHRHLHLRATDFDNALAAVPSSNTKAGWQGHLDGIYPILTSDDFNSQATESGATLELEGGPTRSGKWLRRQTSAELWEKYPANVRLRNWNLFSNSSGYKSAVYVSYYLQTFVGDDTGKHFRIWWRRDLPSTDSKYNSNLWLGKSAGSSGYTWRLEWSNDGQPGGYSNQQFEIDGKWNRVEVLMDFDNDEYAMMVNGQLLTYVSRGYTGVIEGQMGLNSVVRYALLGNTVDPRAEDGHHLGWAQPFADFSLKRIELADSPNWANKTKSVIQPVKSWESDNIEFIINQGDFEDLTDKHIFYVDGLEATYVGKLH